MPKIEVTDQDLFKPVEDSAEAKKFNLFERFEKQKKMLQEKHEAKDHAKK